MTTVVELEVGCLKGAVFLALFPLEGGAKMAAGSLRPLGELTLGNVGHELANLTGSGVVVEF